MVAAVALAGTEDVARGARGVHAHHDGLSFLPVALLERQVRGSVVELGVSDQLEGAPLGGQGHLLLFADEFLFLKTVSDEFLNARDFDAELFGHLKQLRHSGHGAVRVDDLDERTYRVESGELAHVHGGFRVSRTHEHASVACAQGVYVSRTAEVVRLHRRVRQGLYGGGPVVHRHARGAAVLQQIHGHCERSAQERGVVGDLHLEIQLLTTLSGHRRA